MVGDAYDSEPWEVPDLGLPLPVVAARPVPAHAVPLWPLGVRLMVRVVALSWPFFWALLRYMQQPAYPPAGCVSDCVDPKTAYAHGIFPWLFAYSVVSLLGVNSVIFLLRQRRGGTAAADDLPVPFIAKFATFVVLCGVAFAIGILRGMSIWIYGR
ncbi:hypothetical protein [Actinospica robiniae]|uniref:hypothetical protein n=1 Tax=Actinospica robiniae TaxID=304901 RepID=UPI0004233BC0|nr:hypothetical protein [Actinospica robiniae]